MQLTLTAKQVHDLVADEYCEQKIAQCESFLDDVPTDSEEFKEVNAELQTWITLKGQLEEADK